MTTAERRLRRLRERYKCYACGAEAGEGCRTIRHHPGWRGPSGKPTQPHESRWEQYRKEQASMSILRGDVSVNEANVHLTEQEIERGWAIREEGGNAVLFATAKGNVAFYHCHIPHKTDSIKDGLLKTLIEYYLGVAIRDLAPFGLQQGDSNVHVPTSEH